MLKPLFKAIAQLSDPRVRGVVWKSIGSALVVFVALWLGLGFALAETQLFSWGWLEAAIDLLGGLAALVLTFILFPAVASVVMGFFVEEVAEAVETRHYPQLGAPRKAALSEIVLTTVKFALVTIALNIIVLPLYLIPVVNLFVFYLLNGYLLSREYFELAALRRADATGVAILRRRYKNRLLLIGIVIAFLMTVPVVNLLAPVIATATMVHVFQRLQELENQKSAALQAAKP